VVSYCRKKGAKEVRSFVLVEKLHDRKSPADFFADYIGVRTEDHYLFGYGMDYKSYLRNAAGIYAVKATDLAAFNKK
jgi:hypoxanthine phosphoribosyltransferase